MNEREIKILTDRLIPVPQELEFKEGNEYLLKDNCRVTVTICDYDNVEKTVLEWFKLFWGITPDLSVKGRLLKKDDALESYTLEVDENQILIDASGATGVMNALKTLRQLAEAERGVARTENYFLVPCRINDFPAMAFRGVHLCIFPETPLWDIERQIRIAAYHKFNYAVIECWGVFPFESHPEMGWADKMIDKEELKRLIRLGPELGITLIPQFNLLGHATASRSITGKHAVLSYDPSLQSLFEPEGWTWCLTNPETRKVLTDLVMELYEFFDYPPFFHIGCDEADNIGTCRDCRREELKNLVKDHICYFHDLFAREGTRLIMWHDMLLQKGDKRWYGYIVCGLPEHDLSELYKELPRDIIIADWQYGYPKEKPEDPEPHWPTAKFFKEEEFPVLVCPWLNQEGTKSLGRFAAEEKLFGMLETTWHISHDRNFSYIYCTAAYAAWNPAVNPGVTLATRLALAHHLRQLGWDTGIDEYIKTGWNQYQVDPGHHPHTNV